MDWGMEKDILVPFKGKTNGKKQSLILYMDEKQAFGSFE
jgi:predicted RNA-binding protein (virulence factor B family)